MRYAEGGNYGTSRDAWRECARFRRSCTCCWEVAELSELGYVAIAAAGFFFLFAQHVSPIAEIRGRRNDVPRKANAPYTSDINSSQVGAKFILEVETAGQKP